jgi:hypothetical protein
MRFLEKIETERILLIVNPSRTSDSVYVKLDKEQNRISSFERNNKTNLEWSGIAYLTRNPFRLNDKRYVYEVLSDFLPLDYFEMNVLEIDTWQDYQNAITSLN